MYDTTHHTQPGDQADKHPRLTIAQLQLVEEGRVAVDPTCSNLAVGAHGGRLVLTFVESDAVSVIGVADLRRPQQLQRIFERGLRGAAFWRQRLVTWGDGGLTVRPSEYSAEGEVRVDEPVVDVTSSQSRLFVLRTSTLDILDDELSRIGQVPSNGAHGAALCSGKVVLLDSEGLQLFDLNDLGVPQAAERYPLDGGERLSAVGGAREHTHLFVARREGGGALFDCSGDHIQEAATFSVDPWFSGAVRTNKWFARLEADRRSLALYRRDRTAIL